MNLDDPLASSRVVFLHAPWLPSTEGMIGAPQLARLQDGATFTNTARGALVDEAALIAERRRVAVVAVDHPSSLRSKDQVGMNLYDSSAIAAAPVPSCRQPAYCIRYRSAGAASGRYSSTTLTAPIPGGTLTVRVTTDYPPSGEVTVTVIEAPSRPVTITMRNPSWSIDTQLTVNRERRGPQKAATITVTRPETKLSWAST
jgi:hypothetical protein